MLRISKLTDYATVILAALCEKPDTVLSAAGIAESTRVGLPTVSKLLKELQRAGLVRSIRGARGGYQLAREPDRISAADIIDAVEGPVALTECSSDRSHCGIEATCQVGHSWQQVSRSIHRALAEVPLTTLTRHDAAVRVPDLRPGLRAEWRPLTRL
jgi:FeS assembly SUF system regulator